MNSKAYCGRNVNHVSLEAIRVAGRDAQQPAWAGVDVGKYEVQLVVNWGPGDFERPWRINNPHDVPVVIELLKRLSIGGRRKLIVAMEPSGTYGDVLRQACADASLVVHRVHPKIAHDYAEVFDGVPSQHDGKDAAVVAELARLGKSAAWPWQTPPESIQQIEYWVDRMDAQRRLMQMYTGRIEALLARHWPEALRQLKLTSPTLLNALLQYGGPAALAADAQSAAKLRSWGRHPLSDEAIDRIIDGAKRTLGVRQQPIDLQRLRDHATEALAARAKVKIARKRLAQLSRGHKQIGALASAVGAATACVLVTHLGEPSAYHCAAAYVKAMGLNLAERSSGTYKGRLKISKRGSSTVRFWMYLAALRLIKRNSPVRPWYLRKKQRDCDKSGKALVGIMRKLGRALYQVAACGELFDPKRLFPGGRVHTHAPQRTSAGSDNRKPMPRPSSAATPAARRPATKATKGGTR